MWGLSNGVFALAIAGAFWFGLAAWSARRLVFFLSTVLIAACSVAIVIAGVRIRRKARGFKLSELEHAGENQRRQARKIVVGFRWTNIGQMALIYSSIIFCIYFRHVELLWPLIGLIVSLHFFPLAWLFRMRPYYFTAVAGTGVSLASIWGLAGPGRLVFLGSGMGLVVWLTVAYVVCSAERIAAHALLAGESVFVQLPK
jgi:hypothetical protein